MATKAVSKKALKSSDPTASAPKTKATKSKAATTSSTKSSAKTESKTIVKSDAKLAKEKTSEAKIASAKATDAKPAKSAVGKSAKSKAVASDDSKSWYDYPEYYELGFLKETPKESKFLEAVFKKHVKFPVEKVLELGCGSGRLIRDMAKRGFKMTGLDLNKNALDFCRDKLNQDKTDAELVVGDMTDFKFDEPFDAAVNAINTFRHLETEAAAVAHLKCIAAHLKPGGVFVLSLHLLPKDGDLWGTERWGVKQGDLSIYYALTVVETSMKTRLEKLRISMLVRDKEKTLRLSDHITLRIYTAEQLKSLLAKVKQLELVAVYDFWYDVKLRRRLSGSTCDAILVLKKV